jgi:hypothetical protein
LGLGGFLGWGQALGGRPAVEPRDAVAAGVAVWQLVGGMLEGFVEGDELVAALAEHVKEQRHGVGIQLVGVDEQDLRGLGADDFERAFLEVGGDAFHVAEVLLADLLWGLAGGVDTGEGPVGGIDGDWGDLKMVFFQKFAEA